MLKFRFKFETKQTIVLFCKSLIEVVNDIVTDKGVKILLIAIITFISALAVSQGLPPTMALEPQHARFYKMPVAEGR